MGLDYVQAIITVVTVLAGGSGIAGIIIAVNSKRKNAADALQTIESATSSLVEQYRRANSELRDDYDDLKESMARCVVEIEEMKAKLSSFETRHKKLLDVIERLVHQVKSLNHTPVCGPEELNVKE